MTTEQTPADVTLRPMTRADLPALVRWRQAPHVARWFVSGGPATADTIAAHYGPRIDGVGATRMWVVEVDGEPVGFVQDYRISDHPEFAVLAPDPAAIGLDYVIGEVTWTGCGIGERMLRAWFDLARTSYPDATTYFAAPDHRNVRSRRLLLRVGFVEGVWFDEPQADGSVATVVGHSRAAATG
ncbi:GNAT family N-acetyltransferase [Nocardioides stalactiti]|uniref:GNAT family N-acetyltransferase n=1 Tax=Nocardioides stalactiti TaxID=2755356 RepID=UPI001601E53B|nr:GNAT family N-acetyltransferase [Nocardioides stalactiti]